jgi:hypothetical protein
MTFLKVVVSIAAAALLIIFLNNLMGQVFPQKVTDSFYNSDSYKSCQDVIKDTYGTATFNDSNREYKDCMTEGQREYNDKAAIASQMVWLRAVIILLILVTISIFLFKRYPFFSSSLIGGGLIFALTYPLFTGSIIFFGYAPLDLSQLVKNQAILMKLAVSLLGFAGLSIADILFFEKKHKDENPVTAPEKPVASNIPKNSNDFGDRIVQSALPEVKEEYHAQNSEPSIPTTDTTNINNIINSPVASNTSSNQQNSLNDLHEAKSLESPDANIASSNTASQTPWQSPTQEELEEAASEQPKAS